MKIKQIMYKNFVNISEMTINLKDDVTFFIGVNGSGKTLAGLTGIWFAFKGIAKIGKGVLHADRFRFIGSNGPTAETQILLHDEIENIDITITRKLLKNKTELKITASDKRQLPANFIDDIFNIFSINPMGFAKLDPQEQSVALGVDTSENDRMKKVAYDERHEIGYDVKRLKGAMEEIGDVEAIEKIDIQELLKAKDKIEATNTKAVEEVRAERDKTIQEALDYNQKQTDKQAAITDITRDIENAEEGIKALHNSIERLKRQIIDDKKTHAKLLDKRNQLPTPAEKKTTNPIVKMPLTESTSEVNRQIQAAETINQQAMLYQQSVDAKNKYEIAKTNYDNKTAELQTIEDNRIEYLKSCNLPFANITIDDTGGVLINDRPFSETYFSKGEILRMGIKLAASVNPKLKYVFIPDSQSLDEKNREKLFEELTEAGYQVVAEYVDTEKRKDHGSILLKESKVVESYDDNEDDLNML